MHITREWQDASGGFRAVDIMLADHPAHTGGPGRGIEARFRRTSTRPLPADNGEALFITPRSQRLIMADSAQRLWLKSTGTQFNATVALGDPQGNGEGVTDSLALADGGLTYRRLGDHFADQLYLKDFGAVGDGVANDTVAVAAAFASGSRLSGGGLTYAVSGNLIVPGGLHLEDATLKQIAPNSTARRTLWATSVASIVLKRVKVDRNGAVTDGTIADTAGIWITDVDDLYFEDVEVTGNGFGTGISIINCDRPHLVRPHVHDMRWRAASDPGSEQMVGLWFLGCTNVQVDEPHIHELTGEITWAAGQVISVTGGTAWRVYGINAYKAASTGTTGATPPTHTSGTVSDGAVSWTYIGPSATNARAYNADGLDFGGCTHATVNGGIIERVWEGTDISGSNPNRGIWFYGTLFKNCDAFGFKIAHRCSDSGAVGCRAVDCGNVGFVVSSGVPPDVADNIQWIGCEALDTGSIGTWPAAAVAGFAVLGSAVNASTNVVASHCRARDRQTVPTMQLGYRNETTLASAFRLFDCTSVGHTVDDFAAFTAGMVELSSGSLAVSGNVTATGNITATGNLAAAGITATSNLAVTGTVAAASLAATQDVMLAKWFKTGPYSAVLLVNGLNSNIAVTSSWTLIGGATPTAAFSVGGFVPPATPAGTHLWLWNTTLQDMTIVNEDVSSTAANRIMTLGVGNVTMTGMSAAHFIYQTSNNRWVLMATNG